MTHGRWKSDSVVVAEKSVNNAELSAAELMERRAGAKGNVDQQTTCRAQNRESVSQALERIRQAARHRKKERFTSLLHHISIDLLRLAFFELKRNAAPGVDGSRTTRQTSSADSGIYMRKSGGEYTGHCHHSGGTYRSRMVGSARSPSLRPQASRAEDGRHVLALLAGAGAALLFPRRRCSRYWKEAGLTAAIRVDQGTKFVSRDLVLPTSVG